MKFRAPSLVAAMGFATALGAAEPEMTGMEPQFPQQLSAGDLLRTCAASRLTGAGRERRRYCAGFVSGVEEGVRLLQRSGASEYRVCTPANLTSMTLAGVYVKYGANHKGELAEPAAEVVLLALADAYPCPEDP